VAIPDQEWVAARQRLVGQSTDRAVYDRDTVLWVDGNGATSLPPNPRATQYAFGHSEVGRLSSFDPDNPPYWLHGPALITGPDAGEDGEPPEDAPTRLHSFFGTGGPATTAP
jgi:hypothetical protein